MILAGTLSVVSILIIGIYMIMSIGNTLFENRLDQFLSENARATNSAQQLFYASTASDENSLTALVPQVRRTIQESAPGALGRVALLRTPKQDTVNVVQDTLSPAINEGFITDELRAKVGATQHQQYYQTIEKQRGGFQALVVGSQVELPGAGWYELYTVFDLTEIEETLSFIETTLFIGGGLLVLLIVLVTMFVVQMTVRPIQLVAETSRKLAAGELEVRIPVSGEDEISTLATSFNNMADSIEQQINQLGTLSQLQQRFVSDVSHELRTPLTTIQLASDMIYQQKDVLPEPAKRSTELLQSQTQRFGDLLKDLLEISRIDAGAILLEREPVSLVTLVKDSIEQLEEISKQQGSDIVLNVLGGYLEADVDPRRIRRIIANLLGNAIEHGEGKPIQVLIDSNEKAVAVSVRDWGVGMNEDDVSKVFDRFWRADPSRKRTLGGTGLGLPIALEDTNLHGGMLDVWSEKGRGTCFRLTLPIKAGDTALISPISLPPMEPAELRQMIQERTIGTDTSSQQISSPGTETDSIRAIIDQDHAGGGNHDSST